MMRRLGGKSCQFLEDWFLVTTHDCCPSDDVPPGSENKHQCVAPAAAAVVMGTRPPSQITRVISHTGKPLLLRSLSSGGSIISINIHILCQIKSKAFCFFFLTFTNFELITGIYRYLYDIMACCNLALFAYNDTWPLPLPSYLFFTQLFPLFFVYNIIRMVCVI